MPDATPNPDAIDGTAQRRVFGPARVHAADRSALTDVMEIPADAHALLGYVPLELMDLVVNPRKGVLEGNPDHDGKWMLDCI